MNELLNEINKLLKELDSERVIYDKLLSGDSKLPESFKKSGIERSNKHIEMIALKIQLIQLKVAIVSAQESMSLFSKEDEAA